MAASTGDAIDTMVTVADGQFYVYGDRTSMASTAEPHPIMQALNDAFAAGRNVGAASKTLLVILTPVQFHENASLRVEHRREPPPTVDSGSTDHIEEVDFDVVDGELFLEESQAPELKRALKIPTGSYRLRFSASGYEEAMLNGGIVGRADSYKLELWPRTHDSDPVTLKQWPPTMPKG